MTARRSSLRSLTYGPICLTPQLTSLPQRYEVRRRDLNRATEQIRQEGTRNLYAAGCSRGIAQSIAFRYRPDPTGALRTETDPPDIAAPQPFADTVAALREVDAQINDGSGIQHELLRA